MHKIEGQELNEEEAALAFEHMHPQLADEQDLGAAVPERLGDARDRNVDDNELEEQTTLNGEELHDNVQGWNVDMQSMVFDEHGGEDVVERVDEYSWA